MSPFVRLHVAQLREHLSAVLASVRLVDAVLHLLVLLQIVLGVEFLVALRALVLFLLDVQKSFVTLQIADEGEALAAKLAAIRFLVRVRTFVNLLVGQTGEDFVAVVAHVRRFNFDFGT